ncbi:MAG: SurA N-terminal domain-containing protein [Deltaproteobacteria bacterium]
MLKLLRNKKVSKNIFYVLTGVTIIAFIFWGSASVRNKNKTPRIAGRMFGEAVSMEKFLEAYQTWLIQLRFQYGEKASEAAAVTNPLQATWERLLIMREIRKREMRVTDQEVVGYITRLPFLQRNGRFDKRAYDIFLRYSIGTDARPFEEAIRQNLLIAKFVDALSQNVTASDEEVRDQFEKESVETQIRYVSFPYDAYKDRVSISEDEIKSFYAASRDSLRVPPQINVQYIGLEFAGEAAQLSQDERNKKIQDALATARQKGLKLAAKELGFEVKETGFFGLDDPIPEFGWLPQLSRVLFDLPVLSFSRIVQTDRGLYVFQITEKKNAYIPDIKEAEPRIKEILTKQKSKEAARAKADAFLDLVTAQKVPFEDAAKRETLEAKETPAFTREDYIPELGMAPDLKKAAFALKEGAVAPEVLGLEQSYLVIQSMKTPVFDQEAFEKVKEAFRQKVLNDKRNEAFKTYFLSLKERSHIENFVTPDMLR